MKLPNDLDQLGSETKNEKEVHCDQQIGKHQVTSQKGNKASLSLSLYIYIYIYILEHIASIK